MTWRDAFRDQAESCAALGSPFTARVLTLLADRGLPPGPVMSRIAAWPGNITSRGESVPLRLAGALHGAVLERRAPALAMLYPPNPAPDDGALHARLAETITVEAGWIDRRLDSAPQTNEVGRSAVLIAAAAWLTLRTGLPLVLSELGASAGLNLNFDRFALAGAGRRVGPATAALTLAPDWSGPPPEPVALRVLERRGADLAPPDPVADRLRLLSFLWPDQPERMARMRAALAEAARHPVAVERGDAVAFLARRLGRAHAGALHLVYHTVAWQYFPTAGQVRGEAILQAAGRAATPRAPLARLAMEADGSGPGAGIGLQLWPDGRIWQFGRIDFHGRWIDWRPPSHEETLPW
ncbi:MAG: DUF2332 family protein [Defluviimonas sp.]|uniref:DUF2332 domain-containing protein n=1 Tax=Albidovulum sp. TaxID=1872424 RepID=UPI001D4197F8|nr:DUF2332 family protein [Paracoccaceae bacterium]MCC0065114.1 DUF2332 family protein [Defluviimonas sp.]